MENLQRQIDLAKHGKLIVCEKCGSRFFRDVVSMYKVSRLITGTPEDTYVPVNTFACDECGHVNAEFDIASITDSKSEK